MIIKQGKVFPLLN